MDPNFNGTPGFTGDDQPTTFIDPNANPAYNQQYNYAQQPNGAYQQPNDAWQQPNGAYQQPMQQPNGVYQQPMQPQQPAPKKKTGLIIGIIVAVIAVVALVVFLLIHFLGNNPDGTYVCNTYAAFGMDVTLEVDGDEFTLSMSYDGEEPEEESGTIEFDDEDVTLTSDDTSITGTYDKDEKTITLSEDDLGIELVFEKE